MLGQILYFIVILKMGVEGAAVATLLITNSYGYIDNMFIFTERIEEPKLQFTLSIFDQGNIQKNTDDWNSSWSSINCHYFI